MTLWITEIPEHADAGFSDFLVDCIRGIVKKYGQNSESTESVEHRLPPLIDHLTCIVQPVTIQG